MSVEVLDRLPAPYGLVRYGVAPDHVKMKSVIRVLQRPVRPGRRSWSSSAACTSARAGSRSTCCASTSTPSSTPPAARSTGALGIPGEDLDGSLGSGAFVSWYSGHPDHVDLDPPLDHPGVAVVGAGNVALDVARVLARSADEMAATDVPDPVLDALRDSRGHATCTCSSAAARST